MSTCPVRIVLVDDFEGFRRSVRSMLQGAPELQIVCEVADGGDAVRKAEELQPNLILLDIGLPGLNGIEAARQIRKVSPGSKILMISQETAFEVVQEALVAGACGYVVKMDAGAELLDAVAAVLRGQRFISRRFNGHRFTDHPSE